ncbi:predicted protein [Chaetomium globosum CBS 148.51]|uniref:Uncharacterized protein n=1 Tax=Chaetomium globosum (strain ATCC 6205 / CBS 148.51 / DSM 1962 / NBRC 6347 / NRRL 1970) TaxID=306901 RepID=Q2HAQ5_CHAGB|nr:uncharacterized protein CHGG_02699 [Chaetomium globosum CBS 148.51]EAQ90764.1 predicted protein [Chaetomium globosum CBS 148.51]
MEIHYNLLPCAVPALRHSGPWGRREGEGSPMPNLRQRDSILLSVLLREAPGLVMASSGNSSDDASGPSRAQAVHLPPLLQQLSSGLSELAISPSPPATEAATYDKDLAASEPVTDEEFPDDIIPGTVAEWQKLRCKNRRAVNRGQIIKNIQVETLYQWSSKGGGGGALRLAAALRDPRIKDALEPTGIKITDSEEAGDVFHSATVRREMKVLLTTDPFNDFKPYAHQGDDAATITEMCSTS